MNVNHHAVLATELGLMSGQHAALSNSLQVATQSMTAISNQPAGPPNIQHQLGQILAAQNGINQRLDGIDQRLERLDGIDQRLNGIDQRLDGIDQRLNGIDQRLDGIDQRLNGIDQRLDGIDQRLNGIDGGIHELSWKAESDRLRQGVMNEIIKHDTAARSNNNIASPHDHLSPLALPLPPPPPVAQPPHGPPPVAPPILIPNPFPASRMALETWPHDALDILLVAYGLPIAGLTLPHKRAALLHYLMGQ